MVKSENLDFDEIESLPEVNDTDDVNFRGNLSKELTTQVSQEAGTTTKYCGGGICLPERTTGRRFLGLRLPR